MAIFTRTPGVKRDFPWSHASQNPMSEDFSEEEKEEEVSNEARGFRNYYGEDDEDEIALEEEVNNEGLGRNYDEDDEEEEEVDNEARRIRNYYDEDEEGEEEEEEVLDNEGLGSVINDEEEDDGLVPIEEFNNDGQEGRQFDEDDDENEEQGESYDEDEDDLYWPARAPAKLEVYMQAMKDYEEKCHVDVNSGFKKRRSPTEFNAQISHKRRRHSF